jgi:hypothetical protein
MKSIESIADEANRSQAWSSAHNKTVVDHLWSLGLTPYGPFSTWMQLSFSQKDAASRHILYTELQTVLSEVNSLFTHFAVSSFFIRFY